MKNTSELKSEFDFLKYDIENFKFQLLFKTKKQLLLETGLGLNPMIFMDLKNPHLDKSIFDCFEHPENPNVDLTMVLFCGPEQRKSYFWLQIGTQVFLEHRSRI